MASRHDGLLFPGLRLFLSLLLPLLSASCALTALPSRDNRPAPRDDSCCAKIERYPRWLIRVADPAAPVIGRAVGAVNWRHGHLSLHPALQRDLASKLRPLDIMVTGHEGRLSNRLIPGVFTHALTYLGDENDLRKMSLWNDPAVRPYHEDIREGRTVIHSDSRGITLITPREALDVDRVVVLRPACAGSPRGRQAARMFFQHLGGGFDFRFDSGENRRLYCLELIGHAMPYLNLPTRDVYGRPMIVPDEVLSKTMRGDDQLRLIRYLDAGPDAVLDGGPDDIDVAIRLTWR